MPGKKVQEEILREKRNVKRQLDFSRVKKRDLSPLNSLEDYLKFLSKLQRFFYTLDPANKKTSGKFNKF